MNIIDAAIIILFIIGVLGGIKKGIITSLASFIGVIAVFILSFYLKNPVASFFYKYLPFFSFGGYLKGVIVVNILVYELIAFITCLSVLSLLLGIILKVTGIIEKIFKATIILGFFSKILGALFGFLTSYVLIFIILFVLNQPFFDIQELNKSKVTSYMLNNTPVLSNVTQDVTDTIKEIYNIREENKDLKAQEYNYLGLETMLKNKIITSESAQILVDKGKLPIKNAEILIEKYKEEK